MFEKHLNQVALDILSGNALLFVGSGFSRDCKNSTTPPSNPPTAKGLIDIISKRLDIDTSGYGLEDVTQHYHNVNSNSETLLDLIRPLYEITDIPKEHIDFVNLPWNRIYTTNYDTTVELCFTKRGLLPIPIDLDSDSNASIKQYSVIHLNGYIKNVDNTNFLSKIRLTSSTYWDDRIGHSGWKSRLQRDFAHCSRIVFVGYSLFDIDIVRLLRENPTLKKKTTFIESTRQDPIKLGRLEAFGTVVSSGFIQAANIISDVARTSKTESSEFFISFDRILPPEEIKTITASDARDFFIYGRRSEEIAFLEPTQRQSFSLYRDFAEQMVDTIKAGTSRIVLFGNIGNGKSVLIDQFCSAAHGAGYKVYKFVEESERITTELKAISSSRSIVIIENVFSNISLFEYVNKTLGMETPIICTCRTPAYELRGNELREAIGPKFSAFNIDRFSLGERERLADCLLELGFFGRLERGRSALISDLKTWGDDMRSVILKIFDEDGSAIFRTISTEIKEGCKQNSELSKVLISYFLVTMTESTATTPLVDSLLDMSSYPVIQRHKDIFHDFFDINSRGANVKSSILAEVCLRKVFDDAEVIGTLISIANSQKEKRYAASYEWPILRQLMRFGFIEGFLTSRRKREQLQRYYESLRNNQFYNHRPHFWLQYAIAEMSLGNYGLARTYLETAVERGKRIPDYRFLHIDNHYARYYLESRARSKDDPLDAHDCFVKVSNTLIGEMKSDSQLHYAARVTKYVAEFFYRANRFLNDSQKLDCLRRLDTLRKYVKRKDLNYGGGKSIYREAISAIDQAIEILKGIDVSTPLRGNENEFTSLDIDI